VRPVVPCVTASHNCHPCGHGDGVTRRALCTAMVTAHKSVIRHTLCSHGGSRHRCHLYPVQSRWQQTPVSPVSCAVTVAADTGVTCTLCSHGGSTHRRHLSCPEHSPAGHRDGWGTAAFGAALSPECLVSPHEQLLDCDQELYRNFPLVISERWQQEVVDTVYEAVNADTDKVEARRRAKGKQLCHEEGKMVVGPAPPMHCNSTISHSATRRGVNRRHLIRCHGVRQASGCVTPGPPGEGAVAMLGPDLFSWSVWELSPRGQIQQGRGWGCHQRGTSWSHRAVAWFSAHRHC
jgi:hypothetical protein